MKRMDVSPYYSPPDVKPFFDRVVSLVEVTQYKVGCGINLRNAEYHLDAVSNSAEGLIQVGMQVRVLFCVGNVLECSLV